jgi:hypothetical protein
MGLANGRAPGVTTPVKAIGGGTYIAMQNETVTLLPGDRESNMTVDKIMKC